MAKLNPENFASEMWAICDHVRQSGQSLSIMNSY